jgi:beta-phosphoglucomutase-like phosphatase (HAD superfamily)
VPGSAAQDFGWSISGEQYLTLIDKTDRDAWAVLASLWEARPSARGSLQAIWQRTAGYACAETIAVKDGLLDLLGSARIEQVPVAVGSSSTRDTIVARLSQAGLSDAVGVIAGGDEVARGKPAPAVFLFAAKRLKCELSWTSP